MANIVHFGKFYYPDAGGIESVTACLARGATAAGHNVSVVCFGGVSEGSNEILDGVRIIRTPTSLLLASQPLGLKYFLMCLKEAKRANVIHLHAPNMLGALCSIFLGKKAALLVHWHSDVVNKPLLKRILSPLEKVLLKRANVIVATSEIYARASSSLDPFREKVVVIPIGIPDVKSTPTSVAVGLPSQIRARIGTNKVILAVGRLVPYKGFHTLIEAARNIDRDAIVIVVGDGPLRRQLNGAIHDAGLSERVYLVGQVSDATLQALYERSTLFCLPSNSRAEAFGVVLLEALAYGLPIIAASIPGSGVQWVNQHGKTGLNVPVNAPLAFARACNQILHSDALRAKFSVAARMRFVTEFTEEMFVSRTIAIYNWLASTQS